MDVSIGLWRKLSAEELMLFELWCWRRLLRVPWTARRSNQSILKEISPEYSLEGLMLKLKLQYFAHLMQTDSFEKTLMLGNIEGRRRRGRQRMRWLDDITNSMDMGSGSWWWTGRPGVLKSIGLQRVGRDWATELSWVFFQSFPAGRQVGSACHLSLHSCLNLRISTVAGMESSAGYKELPNLSEDSETGQYRSG